MLIQYNKYLSSLKFCCNERKSTPYLEKDPPRPPKVVNETQTPFPLLHLGTGTRLILTNEEVTEVGKSADSVQPV